MSEPYYADESVTLYLGDWRELISEDFTADLIVTDPPYGETSLDWDVWPGGWPTLAARHARSMWCFGSMRMFLDQRHEFGAWKLSQDVVWKKHRPSTVATDRFARMHEHALHWYQGPWGEVRHETPKVPHNGPRVATARRAAVDPNIRGSIGSSVWEDDGTRWQPTIIEARTMHRTGAINETEKPTKILEPLIQYGCAPGGTVLDLFAGSSSTLAAARNIGRKGVGYEKRESQCEAAALRLSQGVLDFGDAS
jgi:site-specific DNA-methyltransferase (adenine-specific)